MAQNLANGALVTSSMSDNLKSLRTYIFVTIGCAIFSAVYEYYSHQVYSNYMVYLFAIPLVLGVLPRIIAIKYPSLRVRNKWQNLLHNFAIATLAVGSTLQGIFEIYGTTSPFPIYYLIVGAALLISSIVFWTISFLDSLTSSS